MTNHENLKIGVFDSGVGGKSLIESIYKAFPNAEVIFKDDRKNLPYGIKTSEELLKLVEPFLVEFSAEKIDVLVIACNTITTNIIKEIRSLVDFPVVGIEPMIKPAALLSKTGVFTVCATPATLKSKRYAELVELYSLGKTIYEPDCSDWALLIENDSLGDERLNLIIDESLKRNSDVIVLGCTHYHWIFNRLNELANDRIQIIYPLEPVIAQLKRVVEQLQ